MGDYHSGREGGVCFTPTKRLRGVTVRRLPDDSSAFVTRRVGFCQLSSAQRLIVVGSGDRVGRTILCKNLGCSTSAATLMIRGGGCASVPQSLGVRRAFCPSSLGLHSKTGCLPTAGVRTRRVGRTLRGAELRPTLCVSLQNARRSFGTLSNGGVDVLRVTARNFC